MERIGRDLARGVLIEIGKWFLLAWLAIALVQAAAGAFGIGWDSTDSERTGERSGLRLRIDYATGCQYLESRQGALTPRMKSDGNQACAARAAIGATGGGE